MKKYLLISALTISVFPLFSKISKNDVVQDWDGIEVLIDSYGRRISPDGTKIVGETSGGTTYYDRSSDEVFFYTADFGRGNVIANNGWIVGNEMRDYEEGRAVVMANGTLIYPPCFDQRIYGNIHGITPDASRICGVIGGNSTTYRPYVCDIDENGNFGELQMLPTPSKDFFNQRPQYCSAVWISEDGNTVAGQVIDARGVFVYPIVYTCDESGEWSYSFPSETLFNPNGLPIPKPLGDIEQEFPDAPFPQLEKYMSPEEWEKFQEAIGIWNSNGFGEEESPYNFLYLYMTEEDYTAYLEAERKYLEASIIYNEMMNDYWDELYEIADESVFFVRNAMALSPNGKWLAMSAQVDEALGQYDYIGYYVPYLMNLETGEAYKIGANRSTLVTNQVMNDGTVLANTLPGDIPASGYIYTEEKGEFVSFFDYVKGISPQTAEWMTEYLTGEAATGLNPDGSFNLREMTVTGVVSASDDFSVICGGVDGYNIGKNMYMTYILEDLPVAGIEDIKAAENFDGIYRVYNLQGVKVAETKDLDSLTSLAKGLYIINGKKAILK